MDSTAETIASRRSDRIKRIAESLGFAACGICPAWPIERGPYVRQWVRSGQHGEMEYLAESLETRLDPGLLHSGARNVIVVAWLYRVRETADELPATVAMPVASPADQGTSPGDLQHVSVVSGPLSVETPADTVPQQRGTTAPGDGALARELPVAPTGPAAPGPVEPSTGEAQQSGPIGRIARYAWGRDYHRVMRTRLYKLVDTLRAEVGEPFKTRVCVDIWPVMERELAARAGIGWIGGNCLVLSRSLGSYFCLGTVLTTLDLAADQPVPDGCGTCRRCVDACPTGALSRTPEDGCPPLPKPT